MVYISLQVKKQQMSVTFRQELLAISQIKTDSRIGLEIAKLAEPNFDLVQLLGRSLPHIVPNVNLSKREVSVCIFWVWSHSNLFSSMRELVCRAVVILVKFRQHPKHTVNLSA